jgi:uncharacterized membrane protein YfhO
VIKADETGYYYAIYEATDVDNISMTVTAPSVSTAEPEDLTTDVDGTTLLTEDSGTTERTRNYTKTAHNYTLDLGYCTAGSEIKITNTEGVRLSVTAYRLSLNAFLAAFAALDSQTMEITSFSDTGLTGEISVETPGDLILSIANEDGWRVLVDGETAATKDFGGAFMSIPLSAGDHVIEMSYTSPGFALGALISIMCIMVFVQVMILSPRH